MYSASSRGIFHDLSHYFVGREFRLPVEEEHHRLIRRILDNAWNFHGRVASREQVQISIGFPQHQHNVDLFKEWWDYGFRSWQKRAATDAELVFLCELGPPEYAITGADGHELSDRWEDSQALMRMAKEIWEGTKTIPAV